jgi:hypothetical protein
VLESAVWRAVYETLVDPAALERELARRRAEAEAERRRLYERLAAAQAALSEGNRKLATLLAKELDGYPTDLLAAHRWRLLAQRADLLDECDRLATQARAVSMGAGGADQDQGRDQATAQWQWQLARAGELLADLPRLSFADRRRLLDALQVRVTVLGHDRIRLSGIFSGRLLTLSPLDPQLAGAGVWGPPHARAADAGRAVTGSDC